MSDGITFICVDLVLYFVTDICRLQADVGPCVQFNTRWHYNSITQSCEEFTYGGCLGNHNNFESATQCMTYCDSSRWARPRPTRPPTTEKPDEVIDESSGEIAPVEPATGVGMYIDFQIVSSFCTVIHLKFLHLMLEYCMFFMFLNGHNIFTLFKYEFIHS